MVSTPRCNTIWSPVSRFRREKQLERRTVDGSRSQLIGSGYPTGAGVGSHPSDGYNVSVFRPRPKVARDFVQRWDMGHGEHILSSEVEDTETLVAICQVVDVPRNADEQGNDDQRKRRTPSSYDGVSRDRECRKSEHCGDVHIPSVSVRIIEDLICATEPVECVERDRAHEPCDGNRAITA